MKRVGAQHPVGENIGDHGHAHVVLVPGLAHDGTDEIIAVSRPGFGLAAAAEPSDGLRASSWRIRVS